MNLDDIDVWIVDSSALIATKTIVSVTNQWDTFKKLEQMVRDGQIAMPRQVINEVTAIAHPDLPGAWAPGVRGTSSTPWTCIIPTSERSCRSPETLLMYTRPAKTQTPTSWHSPYNSNVMAIRSAS